jgi:hypothetical protein
VDARDVGADGVLSERDKSSDLERALFFGFLLVAGDMVGDNVCC